MTPFCNIRLNPAIAMIDRPGLVTIMKECDPVVYTIHETTFMLENCQCMVTLNPEYLQLGEVEMVVEKIRHVLTDVRTV